MELSQCLKTARELMVREKYGEALGYFVCLANVDPTTKTEFEPDFMVALWKWLDVLERHGEYRKMVDTFQEAAVLFPGNETLLVNIGAILFRLGFSDEAGSFFRRALEINPRNVHAKESLESVSNSEVERWHFRMLNDKRRNSAYKEAITKAVRQGFDTVLDIGSGTGILSMFAVQAGARSVYACELSKTMYEVSQDVLQANKMEGAVNVVNKKSTDMCVGQDIPEPVKLVITETMDCGLLGEGILQTISHAWRNLLLRCDMSEESSPVSKVIPSGAVLYGMVISAVSIRLQSRCKMTIADVDLTSVNIIGGEQIDLQDGDSTSDKLVEPYTTESLNSLHSGYTPLSEPFVITTYDFCDPESLDGERELSFDVRAKSTEHIDAIAVWFDLHLDDTIHINTGPSDESLCWEQAVFPVHSHHLKTPRHHIENNELLLTVNEGDFISISAVINEKFLKIQCCDVRESTVQQSAAAMNCRQDSPEDIQRVKNLTNGSCFNTEHKAILLPSYLLRLSDTFCCSTYSNALTKSIHAIHSTTENMATSDDRKCRVLDNMSGLPVTALVAAREGASDVFITNPTISPKVIEHIRKKNNIPNSIQYGPKTLEDIALTGRTWDIFVTDLVEPSGTLRQQAIEDIVFSRGCLLKKDCGIVVPRELQAWSMLIDSETLMALTKVVNKQNTLGLEIGQFINEFQVSTQVNIDLSTLKFNQLSETFELFDINFMKDFSCDEELLSLLDITRKISFKITRPGSVHALPYWFKIGVDEKESITTFSGGYEGSHWRQAVYVLTDAFHVEKGDYVDVNVTVKDSCISLDVKKAPSTQ